MRLLYPIFAAGALVAAMFTYDAVRVGLWKRRVKAVTWAEVLQRIRENCPQVVTLEDGRRVCAIVLSDPRKPPD